MLLHGELATDLYKLWHLSHTALSPVFPGELPSWIQGSKHARTPAAAEDDEREAWRLAM